jgi:chromosome condensin MukBEF complex kleisin-like MukF subunit
METKINYINELSLKVYQKIGEEQLKGLLIDGKPLMEIEEISEHINSNMDDYLCSEEQKQIVVDNIGNVDNEELRTKTLNFAIDLAALYVYTAIQKTLSSTEFIGDNPFSALTNPKAFMIHKYYDEKLGVKLRFRDSGLTAPI